MVCSVGRVRDGDSSIRLLRNSHRTKEQSQNINVLRNIDFLSSPQTIEFHFPSCLSNIITSLNVDHPFFFVHERYPRKWSINTKTYWRKNFKKFIYDPFRHVGYINHLVYKGYLNTKQQIYIHTILFFTSIMCNDLRKIFSI